MVTKYEEYHATNPDGVDNPWDGETFTPQISHTITKVKIKLSREGNPGTVTVSIRNTDGGGLPTGSDLVSGTFDGNTVVVDGTTGEEIEVTLSNSLTLNAGVKYAIVVHSEVCDDDNHIVWWCDFTTGAYSDGELVWSNNGTTWYKASDIPDPELYEPADCWFEEWGNPVPTPINKAYALAREEL